MIGWPQERGDAVQRRRFGCADVYPAEREFEEVGGGGEPSERDSAGDRHLGFVLVELARIILGR